MIKKGSKYVKIKPFDYLKVFADEFDPFTIRPTPLFSPNMLAYADKVLKVDYWASRNVFYAAGWAWTVDWVVDVKEPEGESLIINQIIEDIKSKAEGSKVSLFELADIINNNF